MVRVLSCALLALVGSNAAQAQDAVIWAKDIQGWHVAIDKTISNSCFIVSGFENEQFLRFQLNAEDGSVQFIVASVHWGSLETGSDYDIGLAFGELDTWSAVATGHRWHDILPSLVVTVPFSNSQATDFMEDFTNNPAVSVSYNGSEIAELALDGAESAVAEMMACQAAMSSVNSPESKMADPFTPIDEQT